jgi:hypothetical protein
MDLHRSPSRCGLPHIAPITDTLSNCAAAGDAGMMRHRHNISRYRCCFGCHSSRNPLTIIAVLRSNESAAMNEHAMQWTCRLVSRVESKAIIGAADPQAATSIMWHAGRDVKNSVDPTHMDEAERCLHSGKQH